MSEKCPWPTEEIDDEFPLLRHIASDKRQTKNDRKFPGADHFAIRKDLGENSLSFNWGKYADIKISYSLIGITIGNNGKFISPGSYVFYKYPKDILKSLPKFEKIIHSPDWNGNPSPIGKPNNKSHALLFCGDFNASTRAVLSLYCQENESAKLTYKLAAVLKEIEELKKRGNNTPFHKDWEL